VPRTPSTAYAMRIGDLCGALSEETLPPDSVTDCCRTPSRSILTNCHGLPSPPTTSGAPSASFPRPTVQSVNGQHHHTEARVDVFGVDNRAEHKRPLVSPITTRSRSVVSFSSATDMIEDQKHVSQESPENHAELAVELSSPLTVRRSTRIRDKASIQGTRFLNKHFLERS